MSIPATIETIITPVSTVSVYPNPSNGQFKVQLNKLKEGKATIIVRDAFGKQVEVRSILITASMQAESFDLRNQASGTYYVQLVTFEGVKSAKVIVSK